MKKIVDRFDYDLMTLSKSDLEYSPINQFKKWFNEAVDRVVEPNAMVLSTSDQNGNIESRVVLLKEFNSRGFIFYTNYNSLKAQNLFMNSNVSLCFFWADLQRQIRINGIAKKISQKKSLTYFNSRPRQSQISAWASQQSHLVFDRCELENRFKYFNQKFDGKKIKKPSFWGGFNVNPKSIEFWQGRSNRLHDRFKYTKKNSKWLIDRLAP